MRTKTRGERMLDVDYSLHLDGYPNQIRVAGAKYIDLINSSAPKPMYTEEELHTFIYRKEKAIQDIYQGTLWALESTRV